MFKNISFHKFQGLRHSGEQSISIITLRESHQSKCFSAQLGDLIILQLKAPKFKKLGV